MAATYPVFLKHTFVSKAKQAQPYTARAHSRYIQRASATHAVRTHLMPENYNERQRWFYDHENGLRKNGRVIDKFTLSIPHEISKEHAEEVLHAFGLWLGQGRAPFMFTLQGFDSTNHHAHFVFVDRDEDGKRVYGTTERNSTRGIKLEWERIANERFADLGYDVQIKVHDGAEMVAANDNPVEDISAAGIPVDGPEAIPTLVEEGVQEDDYDMPHLEQEDRAQYQGSDIGYHIKKLYEATADLAALSDAKHKLAQAEKALEVASKVREAAELKASEHLSTTLQPAEQNAYQAHEALSQYQKDNGKLRGFELFGWKTSTRKQAEQAQARAQSADFRRHYFQQDQKDYDRQANVAVAQERAAEHDALMQRNALRDLYGDSQDVTQAESVFNNTITHNLREIEKRDITVNDAVEAMYNEEITLEEFRAYLVASGQKELLAAYDEGMELSED